MTLSYTQSESFTRTHAQYLASKIAADLVQMQYFYGYPPDVEIDAYIKELIILLLAKCLKMVEYGFLKNEVWVAVTRYEVRNGAFSGGDDKSGRIPKDANTYGAAWHSYLEYNDRWLQLTDSQRAQITASLPFQRVIGTEPEVGVGGWVFDKSYSRSGVSLDRSVYRAI